MFEPHEMAAMAAYGGATGVGLALGLQFMKWLLTFVAGRYDKHQEHLDEGIRSLIDGLRKEVDRLSDGMKEMRIELNECNRKHAASDAEVMRLKAQLQGYGDARQYAALIVASEKDKGKADGSETDI